jgi:hypothetical protein
MSRYSMLLPNTSGVPRLRRIQTVLALCQASTVREGLVLAVVALLPAVSAGPASAKTVLSARRRVGLRSRSCAATRLQIKLASNRSTG